MKTGVSGSGHEPSVAGQLAAGELVATTIVGTTWRVLLPALIGVGLGIWGDVANQTKPWLTVAGMFGGFLVAGILVWKFIRKEQ